LTHENINICRDHFWAGCLNVWGVENYIASFPDNENVMNVRLHLGIIIALLSFITVIVLISHACLLMISNPQFQIPGAAEK